MDTSSPMLSQQTTKRNDAHPDFFEIFHPQGLCDRPNGPTSNSGDYYNVSASNNLIASMDRCASSTKKSATPFLLSQLWKNASFTYPATLEHRMAQDGVVEGLRYPVDISTTPWPSGYWDDLLSSHHDLPLSELRWDAASNVLGGLDDSGLRSNSIDILPRGETRIEKNIPRTDTLFSSYPSSPHSLSDDQPTHGVENNERLLQRCEKGVVDALKMSLGFVDCDTKNPFIDTDEFLKNRCGVMRRGVPRAHPSFDHCTSRLDTGQGLHESFLLQNPNSTSLAHFFDDTPLVADSNQSIFGDSELSEDVQRTTESSKSPMLTSTLVEHDDHVLLRLAIITLYKENIKPFNSEIQKQLRNLNAPYHLQYNFFKYYTSLPSQYVVKIIDDSTFLVYLKNVPNWFKGWIQPDPMESSFSLDFWIWFYDFLTTLLQARQTEQIEFIFRKKKHSDAYQSVPASVRHPESCQHSSQADQASVQLAKRFRSFYPTMFKNYNLAQIRQMIQMSVSLGLLIYEDYTLIPLACSSNLVSQLLSLPVEALGLHSVTQQTLQNTTFDEPQCAPLPHSLSPSTLENVLQNLQQLMNAKHFKPFLLSQLKSKYFQRFKEEFDPTLFGFPRLSDFLTVHCSYFCRFIRHGGRQVLIDRVRDPDCTPSPNEDITQHCGSDVPDGTQNQLHNGIVENDDLRVPKALLSLLPKHRRFHYNITFSFWQYCSLLDKSSDANVSVVYGTAASFTDLLFASILRPTCTEPFVPQQSMETADAPDISSLRWFTREPLIKRRLSMEDDQEYNKTFHKFCFNVLPPRIPDALSSSQNESLKVSRPSKLRRHVTSQIMNLKQTLFYKNSDSVSKLT